jgi:hypothetical protein
MEIDDGDISRERAGQERYYAGEFVQFSDPTKGNGGKQRQDAALDFVPWRILPGDASRFRYARKPLSSLALLMVPGEIALTVTPSAATAFAKDAVSAFVAALAAE